MSFAPHHLVRGLVRFPHRPGRAGAGRGRRFRLDAVCALEERRLLASLLVTSVADSGPGSLRQAILDADAAGGSSTIGFQVAGAGPFVIRPASALPTITATVAIDGYGQPGAHANTLALGDDAAILVQLDGTNAPGDDGLVVAGAGGSVRGLAITGFRNGIHITGAGGTVVAGNFIGVDPTGVAVSGNFGGGGTGGVFIDASPGNVVGGTSPADRNVISGNGTIAPYTGQVALAGAGATGNRVMGNYIGTDRSGTVGLAGNGSGVVLIDAPGNTVGGAAPGAGNLISANNVAGIDIGRSGTDVPPDAGGGNVIQGNLVGTDATGTKPIGNGGVGVSVDTDSNTIGGTTPAARNVISGNAQRPSGGFGISVGQSGNVIQGNFIGTDVTGTQALGNVGDGISFGGDPTIGGATAGAGNLISGNGGNGIIAESGGAGLIQGNLIGTDVSGTKALGNTRWGIDLLNENPPLGFQGFTTIGGTSGGAGNTIVANVSGGIALGGDHGVVIQGNRVGIGPGGETDLGNQGVGILISSSSNNLIGGDEPGAGNQIAYNKDFGGIVLGLSGISDPSRGNEVLSNEIFGNSNLGIDAGADGVTPNSPANAQVAPGLFQNAPVLGRAVSFGDAIDIEGTLYAARDSTFTIQFFADPVGDPSGHGQGQTYLGQATVTTDAAGNAGFVASLAVAVPAGVAISATASGAGFNTSEFAANVAVLAGGTALGAEDDAFATDINTPTAVGVPGVLANDLLGDGIPITTVLVTTTTHGTLALAADGSFTYTPTAGYTGVDTFTYRDEQGGRQSDPATVTIDVVPKVLYVTTAADSGPGSLRQMILTANASNSPGADTIRFAIPGAVPFTIDTTTPLPAITRPTIIDGYSQPGAHPNTLAVGDDAVILVHLHDDTGVDLEIDAGGSTVRGLALGTLKTSGAGGNTIQGNFIGLDPVGPAYVPQLEPAVTIADLGGDLIGGTLPADRNLFAGDREFGLLYLNGAAGVVVQGNYLGMDATGLNLDLDLGSNTGILIYDSPDVTIGGTAPGAGNVIAVFGTAITLGGVTAQGSPRAIIQGNSIGYSVSGTQTPFGDIGIEIDRGAGTLIGGTTAAARNVIVGDTAAIQILPGGSGVAIQGNMIGLDPTGTRRFGGQVGINVAATDVTIGGTASGAGNVISGSYDGIVISNLDFPPDFHSVVQGNLIGTDATGTVAVPNLTDGIVLEAPGITIGGTAPGAGNVIAGSSRAGMLFKAGTTGAVIQGNRIDAGLVGTVDLGSAGVGVLFQQGAINNTVGGATAAAGNTITNQQGAGVAILAGATGDAILSNAIYGNGGPGIDLGQDGVTPNAAGGLHDGSDPARNFPVLVAATRFGPDLIVRGTLDAAPSTTYTLQFFASPAADPSGYGPGQTYLGQGTVVTDAAGFARFDLSFADGPGQVVAATATAAGGTTSEFSASFPIVSPSASPQSQPDAYRVDQGTVLNVAGPGVLANDVAAADVALTAQVVQGPTHGQLTLRPDGSFTFTPDPGYAGPDGFTYRAAAGANLSDVTAVTLTVAPKVFTVTSAADAGPGTLRQAIIDADLATSPAPDTILFAIPGVGPFTIQLATPLPAITHPTVVDGDSQPGSRANTVATTVETDALPMIRLAEAPGTPDTGGVLVITGGDSVVRGLSITFTVAGIVLDGAGGDVIQGNLLGGIAGSPSGYVADAGVLIVGGSGNLVGGVTPAARNVILTGGGSGVEVRGSGATPTGQNVIQGNSIDFGMPGQVDHYVSFPIAPGGIKVSGSSGNLIGGSAAGAGNYVLPFWPVSIGVYGAGGVGGTSIPATEGNVVAGNLIGLDLPPVDSPASTDGYSPFLTAILVDHAADTIVGGTASGAGNTILYTQGDGISLVDGTGTVVQGNIIRNNAGIGIKVDASGAIIGGTGAVLDPAAANVIIGNGQSGVRVVGSTFVPDAVGNSIRGNVIGQNGKIGIDLSGGDEDGSGVTLNTPGGPHAGVNLLQNAPTIATDRSVPGQVGLVATLNAAANQSFLIDFYANPAADPSGHGYGLRYLGTATLITDANGNGTVTFVARGNFINQYFAATATDPGGNTSEFSADASFGRSRSDDYDGDGKADIALYDPVYGVFLSVASSTNQFSRFQFGSPEDKPIPISADFDGDGKADIGVYDPVYSVFLYVSSATNQLVRIQFGSPEDRPIPAVADYDGDGKADIGVYDPVYGVFLYIASARNQLVRFQFGSPEDKPIPVVADYDGDGKADIALYDPVYSVFLEVASATNQFVRTQFGSPEDKPIPAVADYDGDGKADIGVYDPVYGVFLYIASARNQLVRFQFGSPEDKPIPVVADYDGDGKADIALYDPVYDVFLEVDSATDQFIRFQFGSPVDKPIPVAQLPGLTSNLAVGRFVPAQAGAMSVVIPQVLLGSEADDLSPASSGRSRPASRVNDAVLGAALDAISIR